MVAAVNKGSRFLLLMSVGGGSASKCSGRGGRCGGGLLGVDFVSRPRRRDDAGSGVVVRSWRLYRSVDSSGFDPVKSRRLARGSSGAVRAAGVACRTWRWERLGRGVFTASRFGVYDGQLLRLSTGTTPLVYAVLSENTAVVKYLLDHGADPDKTDDDRTPLVYAVFSENTAVVKYLLDHGADPEKTDDDRLTPLHYAAGLGDCEMIELLLAKGAYVDPIADEIGTPLHVATKERQVGAMKTLLDHNADCNKTYMMSGLYPTTPLFHAVNVSSVECVKLLVEAGAVITSDCLATVSLDSTMGNDGSTECLNFILEACANCDAPNDDKHANTWKIAQLKSFGSKAVERKDYFSASAFYIKALDLDPNDATLFSNRSFCCLRMGDGEEALLNALKCRELRPDWPKACYRQGAALMLLEDYGSACEALLDGLKLDPENANIERALREAMESLKTSTGSRAR